MSCAYTRASIAYTRIWTWNHMRYHIKKLSRNLWSSNVYKPLPLIQTLFHQHSKRVRKVSQIAHKRSCHFSYTYIHTYIHTYVCVYVYMYVYMYVCLRLVAILHQIIKRAGEGIAATDGAGRLEEGACDLHRQISIRKSARKKKLSEVAQLWVDGHPTLSEVTQPCQRSPNSESLVAQPKLVTQLWLLQVAQPF